MNISRSWELHYVFFVIMTIVSTVGYENPFKSDYSKLIVSLIIIASVAIIPQLCSDLISLLSSNSIYARNSYRRVQNIPHILVTGNITAMVIREFLEEFYHEDHGKKPRHVVILSPRQPENAMENLLREQKYDKQVYYLKGNPMEDKNLSRV
jgi:hypothetical protein